ncbi:MAG: hypothetical protein AVDCRST_MAG68-1680, partial [uncultured Gemmatimonadetes bacterium]
GFSGIRAPPLDGRLRRSGDGGCRRYDLRPRAEPDGALRLVHRHPAQQRRPEHHADGGLSRRARHRRARAPAHHPPAPRPDRERRREPHRAHRDPGPIHPGARVPVRRALRRRRHPAGGQRRLRPRRTAALHRDRHRPDRAARKGLPHPRRRRQHRRHSRASRGL